jgi:hypothetical protein
MMVPDGNATLIQFTQIYGLIYSVFILALTIAVTVSFINSLIDYSTTFVLGQYTEVTKVIMVCEGGPFYFAYICTHIKS